MKFNDRMIGLLAILGGLAIIAGTFGFRAVPGQQFGSAFFPRIVGVATILAGFVQIIVATPGPFLRIADDLRNRDALCKLAVVAGVVIWLLTVQSLGFLLTTGLLTGALALIFGARPAPAAMVAIGLPILLHLIFSSLLRVPLPRGVIEGWLA
ncbi:tripartite tricarboxylate transporter TctB family protein [Ponticoccus alexandrii]|uniref:DUF1468 domain-containing protein n=1 Tax=Ponticoccus alexandrii TaxID=1943633 RepID=A0ABX7FIC8_9RHOB|nr:tripartite tricarboxylate transporter TctB family protein [Ponticoccus alexandrii]QRF69117.1 hypothetical protein GQA70_22435 [Ponticoccus alexandrii]